MLRPMTVVAGQGPYRKRWGGYYKYAPKAKPLAGGRLKKSISRRWSSKPVLGGPERQSTAGSNSKDVWN